MGLVTTLIVTGAFVLLAGAMIFQAMFLHKVVLSSIRGKEEPDLPPFVKPLPPQTEEIAQEEQEAQFTGIRLKDGTTLNYVGESMPDDIFIGVDEEYLIPKE